MRVAPRHRCDERCACPRHGTPLIYWPEGDDHACQDGECEYAQGSRFTEAEYAAALPRRMQEIADQLSECLPEGMRFEWGPR